MCSPHVSGGIIQEIFSTLTNRQYSYKCVLRQYFSEYV